MANMEDIDIEWQSRRDRFYNVGYKEGLDEGKSATIQEGFDKGYKTAALEGFRLGEQRGKEATTAALRKAMDKS